MNENSEDFEDWYKRHKKDCSNNYSGSAGKMEIDVVVEMYRALVEKHGVKYIKYIGKGNSKTFKGIIDSKPYGNDIVVQNKECVSHFE